MNNNTSHSLARINSSTIRVEDIDNSLFKILEQYTCEEIANWLNNGLTASDVNRILNSTESVYISDEKAGKVASIFNQLLADHSPLFTYSSHPWRYCMNDSTTDSTNNINKENNIENNSNNVLPAETTQNEEELLIPPKENEALNEGTSSPEQGEETNGQITVVTPPRPKPDYEITIFICLLGVALCAVGIYLFRRRIAKQQPQTTKVKTPILKNSISIRTNNERLKDFCRKAFPGYYVNGIFYFTESMIGKMDANGYWTKEIVEEIAEKSNGAIKMIWPDIGDFYSPDTMKRAVPYTSKCKVTKVISPGIIINGKVIRKAFVEVTDNF